jgi:serine/threonine protein kinase
MGNLETKLSEPKLSSNFPNLPQDQKALYDARYGDIILTDSPESGPLAIKEKIIDSANTLTKLVEELKDETRSRHMNLVSLHSYKLIKEGNLCSSMQKLYICVEYLKRDLASEIRAKRLQHSFFLEQEVLKIAKSMVSALAFLQKQGVYYGNLKATSILIDNNNNYKIGDPLYFGVSPSYFHCLNQSMLHIGEDYTRNYLPPKLMYALSQKISEPQHNPYKSDVFVLGVILVEVIALRNCYEAFDYSNFCVNWEKLDEIIASAGNGTINYSDGLINFIKKLISFEESKRPDFLELADFFRGAQLRSSSNVVLGDNTRSTLVKSTRSVNDLSAAVTGIC